MDDNAGVAHTHVNLTHLHFINNKIEPIVKKLPSPFTIQVIFNDVDAGHMSCKTSTDQLT